MNFLHSEVDAGPGDVVRVTLEIRLVRRLLQQIERAMASTLSRWPAKGSPRSPARASS